MTTDHQKTEAIARAMALGHGHNPDKPFVFETAESRAVHFDHAWEFFHPDAIKLYYGLKAAVDLKILAPALTDIVQSMMTKSAEPLDNDDANLRDWTEEKKAKKEKK